MSEKRLELAEMIGALRAELNEAHSRGDGEAIRFTLEDIELELNIQTERQAEGKVAAKFFVVSGDAKGAVKKGVVQKIKLKMKPELVQPGDGEGGVAKPVQVTGEVD